MHHTNVGIFLDNPSAYFDRSLAKMMGMPREQLDIMQLAGLKQRFRQFRGKLPILDKLADSQGIDTIDTLHDAAASLRPCYVQILPGFATRQVSLYTATVAPIEGNGVYRLSGFRGTVRIVIVLTASGPFIPFGLQPMGPTLNNYDLDDLKINKDGSFEVILSLERPQGHKGNWWQIDPKSTYVLIRQVAYDWVKETDGRFAIDRLDTPAIPPRPTQEKIDADLKQIAVFTENWMNLGMVWYRKLQARAS